MTEESEFEEIYNLDVVAIPTNKPVMRKDLNDVIYKNERAKFNAIVESVKEAHAKGQPILIGTVSVEKSELLSQKLKEAGIKHTVLNAKYHEQEAEIIAQAGKFGAVTIATNMAGRGTDIMLGGNSEFLAKQEMKANKVPENLIEESNTYYETDDQDILRVRETFKKLDEKYQEQIKEEKEKLESSIYHLIENIRKIGIILIPFMDDTAKNLLRQIGATEELQTWESLYKYNSLKNIKVIEKGEPLFLRKDIEEELEYLRS